MKLTPKLAARLLIAAAAATTAGAQSPPPDSGNNEGSAMKVLEYLPTGSRNENVRIPSLKRSRLSTLMRAEMMTKLDDEHLKLEKFHLEMYDDGEPAPVRFTTPLGIYNTESQVLQTETDPVLERDDFRMTADRAAFHADAKRGVMAGNVKLVATPREEKPAKKTPAAPHQPTAPATEKPAPEKPAAPAEGATGMIFPSHPLAALFGQVSSPVAPSDEAPAPEAPAVPELPADLNAANQRLDAAIKAFDETTQGMDQSRAASLSLDPLLHDVGTSDPLQPLNEKEARVIELTDPRIKESLDKALPPSTTLGNLPAPQVAVDKAETQNPFAGFSTGSGKRPRTDETTIITGAASYFDSDKNITVFNTSVHLDHPEYQIECDDLEVHWEKQPETGEKSAKPEKEAEESAESEEDGQKSALAVNDPLQGSGAGQKMKLAIAKGRKVTVEKLTPDGEINLGECRYLAHDGKTGDMLLRVWPKVQQGNALILGTSINTEILFRESGEITVRGPHLIVILPEGQKTLPPSIDARLRKPVAGTGTAIPDNQNPFGVVITGDGGTPRSDGAVMVVAEECVYDSNKAIAVFRNNVFIDHPEFLMSCDKLDLTFLKEKITPKKDKTGVQTADKADPATSALSPEESQTLKTAVATGNPVRIEKLNPTAELQLAESRHATYDGPSGDLILREWAKVQKGNTVIMGTSEQTRITFFSKGEVKANGVHRIYALPKK